MCSTQRILILFFLTFFLSNGNSQYAPAAGEPGTTAIHKDSSIFSSWATICEVDRGFLKISDTTFAVNDTNRATQGADTSGIGKADGIVVSLGDGGTATLQFNTPIRNIAGPDFAVFENAFKNITEAPFQYFLELAFVEVSSNGSRFVRLPAYSATPTNPQVETFGQLDPTKIHNLAGKYQVFYGTPFDLDDIADSADIDLNAITHIRVVDVIGSTSARYASNDCLGNAINDPWPTPFASGGFDLDAVGVMDGQVNTIENPKNKASQILNVYPNPVEAGSRITLDITNPELQSCSGRLSLTDYSGRQVYHRTIHLEQNFQLQLPNHIQPGTYLLTLSIEACHLCKVIQILH